MSVDDELEKIKQNMLKWMMSPQPPKTSTLRTGTVNELSDANFQKTITETALPVLVDFWAEWCAPCRMMAPIVDSLASELSGRAFLAKLNVDHNPVTAARYGVMSIPNFIVFKGGRPAGQVVGAAGKPSLVQLVQRATL
jgi:thioredoxin 1